MNFTVIVISKFPSLSIYIIEKIKTFVIKKFGQSVCIEGACLDRLVSIHFSHLSIICLQSDYFGTW